MEHLGALLLLLTCVSRFPLTEGKGWFVNMCGQRIINACANMSECIASVHTFLLDLTLHAALSRHLIGSNASCSVKLMFRDSSRNININIYSLTKLLSSTCTFKYTKINILSLYLISNVVKHRTACPWYCVKVNYII